MILRFLKGKEKYYELLKNSLIFGLGLFGAKFIQLFLIPFFTNIFTSSEYGVIDLSITLIELLVPIMTLELSNAILRFGLSQGVDKKSLLKNSLLILSIGIIAIIVLSPALRFYKTLFPWRKYIIVLLIFHCIREQCTIFVKAEEKILIYAFDSFMVAGVVAVFDIIFISNCRWGIGGYFIAEIVGYGVSILFLIIAGKIYTLFDYKSSIDIILLKRMTAYSFPLIFNGISWWITSFSDRAILDFYFSESEVGVYAIASKFPSLMAAVLSVFTQAWIISAIKEYEKQKMSRFFDKVLKLYISVVFTLVSIGIIIIEPILKIYVGRDFYEAWMYVPFLLIGSAFLGVSNYVGSVFSAAKQNVLEMKSAVLCACINIILNLLLIPKYGIMGAVITTMFSYIALAAIRLKNGRNIVYLDKQINKIIVLNTVFLVSESIVIFYSDFFTGCVIAIICLLYNLTSLKQMNVLKRGINR